VMPTNEAAASALLSVRLGGPALRGIQPKK
jgi:hypothetical protein